VSNYGQYMHVGEQGEEGEEGWEVSFFFLDNLGERAGDGATYVTRPQTSGV
jgi:hypothetical protein